MTKYICEGTKYELGGPKLDTIGLPVTITKLPSQISAGGYELFLKSSFHISLVCLGKIKEKHKVTIPDFTNKVVEDFCDYVHTNPIELIKYRDEFRFVAQDDRRTIVVMCDVYGLSEFFDLINKKYELSVEYQPTHVTLYTLQKDLGIFLTSTSDLQAITKNISRPEGVNL